MLARSLGVLGALGVLAAPAAAWAIDDAVGYANRVEAEYKLDVPPADTEAVWAYLQKRYAGSGARAFAFGGAPSVKLGDELFIDRYFDDADFTLLRQFNGVRQRTRYIFLDADNAKHGRKLLQIKTSQGTRGAVARKEIKFDVEPAAAPATREDRHPVLGLVHPKERLRLRDNLREAGVDPEALRPSLTLEQRRRRVYISVDGQPFATLTLDEVRSEKWLREVAFVEIEMELNENAYTAAGPAERRQMQAVLDALKADLLGQFPGIRQDQTPKYNKVFQAFAAKFWRFPQMLALGLPLELLAGLALAGLTAGGAVALRRRKKLRPSPAF